MREFHNSMMKTNQLILTIKIITHSQIFFTCNRLVALYKKTDPKPKIEVFCKEHRIDEATFRGCRNKNKHKN